ncbi:SDR family NAD(P)-dependent oxidoreductase [bacterium]|nr:SDR family NAD(P)-dependent oxidoreductase [bacterium]
MGGDRRGAPALETGAPMRVLVTGATRGIGLAIVEALAEGGRNTIYLGCRDELRGQNLSYMIAGRMLLAPNVVIPIKLDVTDAESIASAAAIVTASGRKLDALVNNAGVLLERDGTDLASLIEPTFSVHVDGVVAVTEAFVGLLRDGGQIVNVSSGAGTRATGALDAAALTELEAASSAASLRASITQLAQEVASKPHGAGESPLYGLSKCAVNFYTRLLARQCPRLRINACSPGFCRTEIAGPSVAYTREPKDASLGASVVLKLLRGELGGTGRFFKESSKPGTPLHAAQSVAEAWLARDGGEKAGETSAAKASEKGSEKASATAAAAAVRSSLQSPPPTSTGSGKRKATETTHAVPPSAQGPGARAQEWCEGSGTVVTRVKQNLAARVVAAVKVATCGPKPLVSSACCAPIAARANRCSRQSLRAPIAALARAPRF